VNRLDVPQGGVQFLGCHKSVYEVKIALKLVYLLKVSTDVLFHKGFDALLHFSAE
jgi:hypothetical protein